MSEILFCERSLIEKDVIKSQDNLKNSTEPKAILVTNLETSTKNKKEFQDTSIKDKLRLIDTCRRCQRTWRK